MVSFTLEGTQYIESAVVVALIMGIVMFISISTWTAMGTVIGKVLETECDILAYSLPWASFLL